VESLRDVSDRRTMLRTERVRLSSPLSSSPILYKIDVPSKPRAVCMGTRPREESTRLRSRIVSCLWERCQRELFLLRDLLFGTFPPSLPSSSSSIPGSMQKAGEPDHTEPLARVEKASRTVFTPTREPSLRCEPGKTMAPSPTSALQSE